jgi:hypothetical protein
MEKEKIVKNPIDCLLDENDTSNITLFSSEGEKMEFEQIALIPIDDKVFAILKPTGKVPAIGENEALVFEIVEKDDEESYLNLVSDIDTIDKVFAEYNKLVDAQEKTMEIEKNKKGKN